MPTVRTRFAPSPTGYLHIGGLRTALFAYLIAKSQGGKLILRIEDTDQKREVAGAVDKLIDILAWAGIEFDEGPVTGGEFGPYIQSQRKPIYHTHSRILLESGAAYRCFCTNERLQEMRAAQEREKKPPRYDRLCRQLSREESDRKADAREPFVIRQAMPLTGNVTVHDELRGDICFDVTELDDHVLIKTDGMPTYQFAVVVDDHLMAITHVVRGEEWLPSFPKNWLLYQAFGWSAPLFIHLPLIMNPGGGKLSKRQGDVAVEDYRAAGYLPVALLNFCTLLGWHPQGDNELFSIDEIMPEFDHRQIRTSPAVFDVEKLNHMNGYHIRQLDPATLTALLKPYLAASLDKSTRAETKSAAYIAAVARLEQERLKKLSEITELTDYLFVDDLEYPSATLPWKQMTLAETGANLGTMVELLEKIPADDWTSEAVNRTITNHLSAKELRVGEYLWPLRVALTGRKASPGPFDVAAVLGKPESLRRLGIAIKKLSEGSASVQES